MSLNPDYWGGYGSVQATPQPTQIINDDPTTVHGVEGGEILILPAQDAPNEQAARESPEAVDTSGASAATFGKRARDVLDATA